MNPYQLLTNVIPFPFWNAYTPTLPSVYWDVDSQEERIKKICLTIHKLTEYADYLCGNLNADQAAIEELQADFEKFQESGFYDYYSEQLEQWIKDNLPWLFQTFASQVYFGLTDDGYFCAYVPESWSDITFDTGAVFGRSDYGRLILRFDADSEGVIDNTYSYSTNSISDIQQLISDVEVIGRRGDASYETLFTNMDVDLSNGDFGV